jgi:hypothetical protein
VNRWTAIVAGFVALVVAAFFLRLLPPIVVLVLFVAGAAYANTRLKRLAKEEVGKTGAEVLGLRRETGDPFGLLAFPLALFSRTTDPGVDELVWGQWRGLDVTVFGLGFDAPSLPGSTRRTALACALARMDATFPSVIAEPQAMMTSFERAPAAEAVELEDRAFDVEWNVWSDDPSFARELLDAPMRDWLRSLGDAWGIEVNGQMAVVYGPRPPRPDMFGVLESLKGLLEHVRSELRAAHPPAASST